jgi:aldose 1-epimerase
MMDTRASAAIVLEAPEARAVVVPAIGGSIASFGWRGFEVLRQAAPAAMERVDVLGMACYPLVPYSNRIAFARLCFAGAEHRLARNFGDHPHSIHGLGWQRAWRVTGRAPGRVALAFDHAATDEVAPHWPWPFRAEQDFELRAEGDGIVLACSLALTNTGRETFPCGLGWHPFFPRTASTRLAFGARGMWQTDATGLPTLCTRPEPWGFAAGRDLRGVALDNVFDGWIGAVRLHRPECGLVTTLSASAPCRHLVVYTPPDGGFVAIEPVTHLTDAFNRAARGSADTGMLSLDPGARISSTMRIAATLLP